MNAESPILDAESFTQALRQAFTAKNTMARIHGYTPEQAVLGIARRLPASLVLGESAASHLLAADEGSSSDHFRRPLELRCSARKAFVEADNCSSLRRALLRRSRPLRDPYEIGDWVLYWKKVGGNMRRERGKWFGPARIAMVEGTKVLWLSHANKLIRASPEQVKPARVVKCTPIGSTDCPVDLRKLSAHRVTNFGNRTETDFWVGTRAFQRQERPGSFWKIIVDVLSTENGCQTLLVCWKPWGAFWNMLPGLASPHLSVILSQTEEGGLRSLCYGR